ncbi:MAG: hypothetical protein KBC22_03335 [Candidatus Pacebacteria bacterium]|nr:hypothetical protein [Candidatus Paceibacterota bacterium]
MNIASMAARRHLDAIRKFADQCDACGRGERVSLFIIQQSFFAYIARIPLACDRHYVVVVAHRRYPVLFSNPTLCSNALPPTIQFLVGQRRFDEAGQLIVCLNENTQEIFIGALMGMFDVLWQPHEQVAA